MFVFEEGGKSENPEKNPQSRDDNQQQTQRTHWWEESALNHSAIPASPKLPLNTAIVWPVTNSLTCFLENRPSELSAVVAECSYLTIILRNRAEYRLILIQRIDNKAQVYSRKAGGDLYFSKKKEKETCNIFPRADWHEWKWQLCSSLNEIESVLHWVLV